MSQIDTTLSAARLSRFAHYSLGVLRIVSALLFFQHGLQKVFFYPPGGHHSPPFVLFSLFGLGGLLEFVGGILLGLGVFTRAVAFVLCGEMAVAYFFFHFASGLAKPAGFFPVVNGGDLAIAFCFIFLHQVFAGPGAFSLQAALQRKSAATV